LEIGLGFRKIMSFLANDRFQKMINGCLLLFGFCAFFRGQCHGNKGFGAYLAKNCIKYPYHT